VFHGLTLALALALAEAAAGPSVRLDPEPALLEPWPDRWELNCDFVVENPTQEGWRLVAIRLIARDDSGRASLRRFVDDSGMNPGLNTIAKRELAPGEAARVFNPFHTFDRDLLLARLEYSFSFRSLADRAREASVELAFTPRPYAPKSDLAVPLRGRVLVFDGHDFYSHHRRWDVSQPFIRPFGWSHNAGRYAYDLTLVDEEGRMHHADGKRKEDWLAFGATLYAPANGRVVEARGDVADHEMGVDVVDPEEVKRNPRSLMGNYLVLDHGNGEYSVMAHMKQASLRVKTGDRVERGQPIGQIGLSGDAYMVHLHYQLVSGVAFDVDGLPSAFGGFSKVLGARSLPAPRRPLDTGEIIEVR
jgi:murein DD-endopeptidase MepM/ murein hydrolase activator NlpD